MNRENQPLQSLSSSSRIKSIQVLRALAALIVAVYHSRDLIRETDPFKAEIQFLSDSGPAGVPLFFIISGFIMVYITKNIPSFSPADIYRFVAKRFLRIWPTYAVLTLLFYVLHHGLSAEPGLLKELARSLCFLPLSEADPPFYGTATLTIGWTLNFEIYFYCLVSISLFFSKYRWHTFFALLILTLVIIPLSLGHFTFKPDRAAAFGNSYLDMITNPIIWNFAYGVMIGLLYTHRITFNWLSRFFSKGSTVLFVVAWYAWQYLSGFFGGFGPFQWGAGAAGIMLAFLFYNVNRPLKFPDWLIWLGDISFSIYLLHIPVIVMLRLFFAKIGFPAFESGTAIFMLTICMTIVAAALSHKYLEIGLSNMIKDLLPNMIDRKIRMAEKSKRTI